MRSDARHRACRTARAAALASFLFAASWGGAVHAQGHLPEAPGQETASKAEGPHEQTTLQTVAKLANFAVLAGVLVYFLRGPISIHLASRASHIRQDLVTAAEMRAAATARMAEIARKLESLPAELDALRAQGAEDVAAEQARIAAAAAAERTRLLEQTRREIETRLRVARRELTAHAAQLAVNVAEARIRQTITADDQLRLVDRFTSQLKEAR
ncbi:MAG: hypothetical protein ABJC51_06155 [Acidobacteriota bacterium]